MEEDAEDEEEEMIEAMAEAEATVEAAEVEIQEALLEEEEILRMIIRMLNKKFKAMLHCK